MEKYIGMNFKEWCSLDEEDDRIMHLSLETEDNEYHFKSNEKYPYIDFLLLCASKIIGIKMIDNEWYIDLVAKKRK